ncbi:hypothetical protein JX265_003956 [Neoarthrinium moseri]|uniref:Uncharacterized protein n=1 Tax=Neoarthrinium moseri TaxID=1658444 RepID=A0A9Q0ARG3_9PEZI|nr:hypothetical protein JX265_003956 [Neoarthrinium moseri]
MSSTDSPSNDGGDSDLYWTPYAVMALLVEPEEEAAKAFELYLSEKKSMCEARQLSIRFGDMIHDFQVMSVYRFGLLYTHDDCKLKGTDGAPGHVGGNNGSDYGFMEQGESPGTASSTTLTWESKSNNSNQCPSPPDPRDTFSPYTYINLPSRCRNERLPWQPRAASHSLKVQSEVPTHSPPDQETVMPSIPPSTVQYPLLSKMSVFDTLIGSRPGQASHGEHEYDLELELDSLPYNAIDRLPEASERLDAALDIDMALETSSTASKTLGLSAGTSSRQSHSSTTDESVAVSSNQHALAEPDRALEVSAWREKITSTIGPIMRTIHMLELVSQNKKKDPLKIMDAPDIFMRSNTRERRIFLFNVEYELSKLRDWEAGLQRERSPKPQTPHLEDFNTMTELMGIQESWGSLIQAIKSYSQRHLGLGNDIMRRMRRYGHDTIAGEMLFFDWVSCERLVPYGFNPAPMLDLIDSAMEENTSATVVRHSDGTRSLNCIGINVAHSLMYPSCMSRKVREIEDWRFGRHKCRCQAGN